jgi:hypothetical protein
MSSSTEAGPSGISTSSFTSGDVQQGILKGIAGQTAAAQEAAKAQGLFGMKSGGAIRDAGENALVAARANVARGVAAGRGSGVATGGGLGGASGSTAVNAMREQIAGAGQVEASAVAADQAALTATSDLRSAAALAVSEEAIKAGELKGGQQKAGIAWIDEMAITQAEYEAGNITEEEAAAQIAGKVVFLDPNDPTQRLAIKQSFNQLWMMATEAPELAPSDAMLDAMLSAGIDMNIMFSGWTGGLDASNSHAFWGTALEFYNNNRPSNAPALSHITGAYDSLESRRQAIEAAILSL